MPLDPRPAEPAAFEREIGNLVERIELAQIGAELQAIDDPRQIPEIDMFGPQVAVAIDQAMVLNAPAKQRGAARHERVEASCDRLQCRREPRLAGRPKCRERVAQFGCDAGVFSCGAVSRAARAVAKNVAKRCANASISA